MGKESVKEENNERVEIFLDKIICENKIKSLDKIKSNDIKLLNSLLDVSRFTLWRKSVNGEKGMRKKYTEFYKKVSKSLSSLQKHCKEIDKFKASDSLSKNIEIYKNSKEEIEKLIGKNEKFSYAKYFEPREVGVIKKINELTKTLNGKRESKDYDGYRTLMLAFKIDPHVLSYEEFEKDTRKISKTKDSFLLNINAFIKYNKDRQEKEQKAMQECLKKVIENNNKIKNNALNDLRERLKKLENLIGTKDNKVDLQKFINEDKGCSVNEDFIGVIVDAFQAKLASYGLNEKLVEEYLETLKSKISTNGILNTVKNVGSGIVSLVSRCFNSVCSLWNNNNSNVQAENDAQVDSELIKKAVSEIEEIGEAFLNFNESNNEFIKLVESQQCGHEEDTMKNINADYVGYISDIESAMNPIKNENDANEYNRRYNEKFGGLVAKANSEDEKKENLKNISDFVASLNAITSEIPKIKKEYRGAQDDASAIKKLVKYYVKFVKDNIGVNIINKTNISEWKPPANISNTPKIKLSQAIPYVYYCVSKYEENGFGLNKDIVEVIEESDRATFGMTLRDIKQAVKSKNV